MFMTRDEIIKMRKGDLAIFQPNGGFFYTTDNFNYAAYYPIIVRLKKDGVLIQKGYIGQYYKLSPEGVAEWKSDQLRRMHDCYPSKGFFSDPETSENWEKKIESAAADLLICVGEIQKRGPGSIEGDNRFKGDDL
jgi:hypothetical protein